MLFKWPKLRYLFLSYTFPPVFFLSIGWNCGARVFGLIGCRSLSPSLALPTFCNNDNNIKLECSKFIIKIIVKNNNN